MKGMLSQACPEMELAFAQLIFMALSLEAALTMEEYTEGYLVWLEKIICKFLVIYRAIVGPFRECFSRSGLRIPKFHGLLHSVTYIWSMGVRTISSVASVKAI